tara:strand:- start:273 stop:542 length:270 start_codon:yes stop_codon:yes gene_type:complete
MEDATAAQLKTITSNKPDSELTCDCCNADEITREVVTQRLQYNRGDELVDLECFVPVYHCANCGISYTDEIGEGIREQTIAALATQGEE